MDASAVGHDYIGKVEKHGSQKDYSTGFGGKYGVQTDRMDASAVGHDYKDSLVKHESQVDHKKGFGGAFGVQTERMDKSAYGFQDVSKVGTNYEKTKPDIATAKPSNLKAKFENMALQSDSASERVAEQKRIREEKDRLDKEQATNEQVTTASEPAQKYTPQRTIVTGRSGGIGSAVAAFNQPPVATPIAPVSAFN